MHVPKILGVSDWRHNAQDEREMDYEHFWRKEGDTAKVVMMDRTRMGWRVTMRGDEKTLSEDFEFMERKAAEARLVEYMLDH